MRVSTIYGLAVLLMSAPAWGATCKISEYEYLADDRTGTEVPVALEPALVTQEVTYTTSTASSNLNADTRFIRVICDAKAHFVFGGSPEADETDPFISSGSPEYFGVDPSMTLQIAFYDGSSE